MTNNPAGPTREVALNDTSETTKLQRPVRVVAIDDEPTMLDFYQGTFATLEVEYESSTDPARGIEVAEKLDPDLVLLDFTMPGMNGFQVLSRIRLRNDRAHVVMVTGNYSIEVAVEAIRKGATDYVCKPISVQKLRELVEQARQAASQHEREEALEKELLEVFGLEGVIGRSPSMMEVFDLIRRVAPHFRTALVLGETGTGKEAVARALHNLSPRRHLSFAVCNCAALTDSLAESQLFGHRKGAFTGADQDRVGVFEWANGGTVFLDEVGELSPSVQSKLLRVLQNGEVQKLGSPQPHRVDVLVIAATSRDLNEAVKAGAFRADLWYRINMVQVALPPLRERTEDILLLARHFLDLYNKQYKKDVRGFTRPAQNSMLVYSWPGNVRELENVVGRACLLCQGRFVDIADLPDLVKGPAKAPAGSSTTLDDAEKAALLNALQRTNNKALAARMLGTSRATLYRLMKKHGMQVGEEEANPPETPETQEDPLH